MSYHSSVCFVAITSVAFLTSVNAASSDIQSALQALSGIGTDNRTLASYCSASKELLAATPEQTEALAEKFDATLRGFGDKVAAALDLHYDLDDSSPDGQALVAVFQKLDSMCGQ